MSDETTAPGAAPSPQTNPQAAPPSVAQPATGAATWTGSQPLGVPVGRGVPIAIIKQYLKDLSFESPNAIEVFGNQQGPTGGIHVDVRARSVGDGTYEVSLCLNVEAKQDERVAYIIEIEYAGHVAIGEVPPEAVEPLLMIEAPRLLFPFARAVLTAVTSDGGFSPLLIQPIDFGALYRDHRRRMVPPETQSA
jgi:preprotein translocase subunit SecB